MSLKGVSQELGEQRREQSLQDCVILSSGAGGGGVRTVPHLCLASILVKGTGYMNNMGEGAC